MNNLESNPLAFATTTTAAEDLEHPGPGWTDRMFRRWVLGALEPMQRGQLLLHLPEGGSHRIGRGGEGPSAEIRIRRNDFFRRGVMQGDVGFGEAYQEGDWDTPDLVAVIGFFCANVEDAPTLSGSQRRHWGIGMANLLNRFRHVCNRNSLRGSRNNIQAHYDLGNEFYSLWLDPTLTYSAALFETPDQPLAEAQTAKYDRLCRQLELKPTDHVLEIGSGWGGFTEHAVRRYGCRVTTLTLSAEQHRHASRRFQNAGIADRARVELRDYREVRGTFDKICSIEMLEAVGDEFLDTYFGQVHRLLGRHGRFAAQFITCPDQRHAELRHRVDWIQKHIFPGSLLLSLNRVGASIERTGDLWLQNLHDLGPDYAVTLRHWRERFNAQLEEVRKLGFDDRFIRTWNYYLAYCEAAFAWRNISVVQATWARPGCAMPPAS